MRTPERARDFIRETYKERADDFMLEAAMVELVRTGVVSAKKGADLLGVGHQEFDHVLAEHDVPTLDLTLHELKEEERAYDRLLESPDDGAGR